MNDTERPEQTGTETEDVTKPEVAPAQADSQSETSIPSNEEPSEGSHKSGGTLKLWGIALVVVALVVLGNMVMAQIK